MVIWLIGISGAGKTTIGRELKKYYEAKGKKTYLIDGDEVRDVFNNDLGYTEKEREENIKRIILAAYVLDKVEVYAIVCNISPFQRLRDLARSKIANYNEIYLNKDMSISMRNDVKNVYSDNTGKSSLVGVDINFDEPARCDLQIDVDKLSIFESVQKVIDFIKNKYEET